LIYLKDQIKDLENNSKRAESQLSLLGARIRDEEADRVSIVEKINQRDGQAVTGQLVSAVQSLTKELLEAEQYLTSIAQLAEEKRKYVQFESDRGKTQDRIATLSNHGRSDLDFNVLRNRIQGLTIKWMDILRTPNASREVEIDLEFKFRFGKQTIDVFNGSTRSRIILAIHAAIFEHYLQDRERPLRFLILDTPKQQELANEDLARYLKALEELCDEFNGQILISATEYHHEIGGVDKEWTPQFAGVEQMMYLGKPTVQ